MFNILDLINELKTHKRVFIQTHNFPDHDAVASAYGLKELLSTFGIESTIIFKGELQRSSLLKMIQTLDIEIIQHENFQLDNSDKIIVVDGCKGNKNVDDLNGDKICVIDHHNVTAPNNVLYVDIRNTYGACSTIIYSYYKELKIPIPKNVATAFIIGINVDTSNLTRGVSKEDLAAFHNLYSNSNIILVNSILRNYIKTEDLAFYNFLINNLKITSNIAFCYFKNGCNQNLLGILADFALSLEEVDFVILCAKNNEVINLSIRNENNNLNSSEVIQNTLKGIGFGGGHWEMAGGIIKDLSKFNEKEILDSFIYNINLLT